MYNLTLLICFQNALKTEYQNEARVLFSVANARYRSTTPLNTVVMFVPQQEVRNLIKIYISLVIRTSFVIYLGI